MDSTDLSIDPSIALPILYQDQHLIFINKPAEILVHRSSIDKQETLFALRELCNQIGQRLYPIDRLGKEPKYGKNTHNRYFANPLECGRLPRRSPVKASQLQEECSQQ